MDEGRVVADVRLAWCGDAIAVKRFGGGEVARIGDGPRCFAYVPCDAPGGWPVVRVDGTAARVVVVPPRGKGRVDRATGAVEELSALVAATLRPGDRARVTIGDFQLDVTAGYGEAAPAKRRVIAFAPLAHVAIAALVHGGALGYAARAAASEGHFEQTSAYLDRYERDAAEMSRVLMRADDRSRAHEDDVQDALGKSAGALVDGGAGDGRQLGGAQAAGDEGKIGSPLAAPKARGRFAVERDASKAKMALAATNGAEDARRAEALGTRGTSADAPSNAWSEALLDKGPDAFAARGLFRGVDVGAGAGESGLGLSGIGEGGGGVAEGVGLGVAGELGHGAGPEGPGAGGAGSPPQMLRGWSGGWSSRCGSSCRMGIGHTSRVIRDPFGMAEAVKGQLPPEIVQAIVRKNFGRFRLCYEHGLKTNPTLEGGVKTRFVIEGDRVVSAEDAGSSMPDSAVTACVVKAFVGIEFPKVSRVTVSYPISFSAE